MRSSVKWLSLALILAGAFGFSRLHEAWYRADYERDLQAAAARALRSNAALRGVSVRFDHLDATLSGTVETPAARTEARRRVRRGWGARVVSDKDLVIPARLDVLVEIDNEPSPDAKPDRMVSVVGFLPESTRAMNLPDTLSGALRGRGFAALRSRVEYHPFVGPLPEFDRTALATLATEFSDLPGIGRLELNADGLVLEGEAFPGLKTRLEELAAAAVRPGPGRVRSALTEVDLTPSARAALAQMPGLEKVEVRFHNAYALLSGSVATPEQRDQAAVAVLSIALVRLNPADNRITVAGARPSFEVSGDAARRTLVFSGLLPDAGWKSRVLDLCTRLKPGWQAETAGLKFSPIIEKAAWLDAPRFGALLESWLVLPAPGKLRLDTAGATLTGPATPAQREEWSALLGALGFAPSTVRMDD